MDTVNGYSLLIFLSTTKDFYGTLLWHFLVTEYAAQSGKPQHFEENNRNN